MSIMTNLPELIESGRQQDLVRYKTTVTIVSLALSMLFGAEQTWAVDHNMLCVCTPYEMVGP